MYRNTRTRKLKDRFNQETCRIANIYYVSLSIHESTSLGATANHLCIKTNVFIRIKLERASISKRHERIVIVYRSKPSEADLLPSSGLYITMLSLQNTFRERKRDRGRRRKFLRSKRTLNTLIFYKVTNLKAITNYRLIMSVL